MPPEADGKKWLDVVGIGEDGLGGLGVAARDALAAASAIYGASRHLAFLTPELRARAEAWPSPLVPFLEETLARERGRAVAILASGDPLFYGIGATIARRVPAGEVAYHPAPSSFALACARLGWAHDGVTAITAVARPLERLVAALAPGRRIVVLSEDGATPARLARLLTDSGYGDSVLTLFEALGGPEERRREASARAWSREHAADLNVVAIDCRAGEAIVPYGAVPGLPDSAYEHDGQLTKRDVRAVTLGRLAPRPGERLWDVGAGAGSIAIEWMRAHPACRAIAFERDPARAEAIARNAMRLGVPELEIVRGEAPASLAGAAPPDAVFIGGGVSLPHMIETCHEALAPGGRLVANAVTLEGEAELLRAHRALGGELVRIALDAASPVGGMLAWRPAMPVVQWTWRA